MRRIFTVFVLLLLVSLCSCGDGKGREEKEEYYFTSGNVRFTVGDDAERVIAELGTPNSRRSSPSCADEGIDEVYAYSGFKIFVHRKGADSRISEIDITSDTAETDLGIRIGDSKEALLRKYGAANEVDGVIEYIGGKCILRFYIRDGAVSAIKYTENDR